MNKQEAYKRLEELIKDITFTMLTTINPDGTLFSHPVTTQVKDFQGELYFFMRKTSEPIQAIMRNPQVNLGYAAPDKNKYVSISGTGELIEDRAQMEKLWSPAYKYYFPDGLETPDLVMLKVKAHSAQFWDSPSNPVILAFDYLKGLVTGKRDDAVGENEELDL